MRTNESRAARHQAAGPAESTAMKSSPVSLQHRKAPSQPMSSAHPTHRPIEIERSRQLLSEVEFLADQRGGGVAHRLERLFIAQEFETRRDKRVMIDGRAASG